MKHIIVALIVSAIVTRGSIEVWNKKVFLNGLDKGGCYVP